MVTLCLSALALLCWPARPSILGPAGWLPVRRSADGRLAGAGRLAAGRARRALALCGADGGTGTAGGSRVGRPAWLLGVLAVSAPAVLAGPAVVCAALILSATVARLAASELRRRRDRRTRGLLLVASRTLAREVRTGASPVTAVLATAAAHPGCAAALDQLAVGLLGRGNDPVTADLRSPARGGGAAQRVDEVAEFVLRLGGAWRMSARFGVPWAALIDTVAGDLHDRERAESLRDAQVAGPRVSGYVLAVMPALGILLGAGMGADPIEILLHTGVGAVLLLVGSTLTCLGLLWTASIVRA